ncbi:MAG: phospholipid carrier-dependent glycosyltransferase [Chloroflexaceae bacterium]|nr:phospholipid carrier-dependent glycosyltransferase [Chloroflexaceae bacterium]
MHSLLFALLGATLIIFLYQLPVTHTIDIGSFDAGYVQGFHDPQRIADATRHHEYLVGSDGSARWSRAVSYVVLPQAGLPASVTLRLRGWRESGEPPRLRIVLNGQHPLATFRTTGDWEEHTVVIADGWSKPSDVVLELHSDTTSLPDDGRDVGVLLDQVTYRVTAGRGGWIMPYPAQVLGGAIAALLLALVVSGPMRFGWLLLIGLVFVFGYRAQPPIYPAPLRFLLPAVVLGLAAVLALRHGPCLVVRAGAWLDVLVGLFVLAWLAIVLILAQDHVTLSVPGVEKDFRVFATRTDSLAQVFQADPFYHLGYPALLWLVRPITDGNAFLAARLLAAISGAVLLLAGYWLARLVLPDPAAPGAHGQHRLAALLALLMLASSPFVVQYALYIGSDMPFAAASTLSVALLLRAGRASSGRLSGIGWLVLAGVAAGCAFLVRHPGLLLLPWGILHVLCVRSSADTAHPWRPRILTAALFAAGFVLAASPQLLVNVLQTGQPLFQYQAKNIWLGVYGGVDWGRWHDVPDNIGLLDVVLPDPVRFVQHWGQNMIGYIGSGAEDLSESGQALQLRLLHWPANWLAVLGWWAGWQCCATVA